MNHKILIAKIRTEGETIEQIAKKLKVKPNTIYRWINSDSIPPKRIIQLKNLWERIEAKENSLKPFTSQDLVAELNRRGWRVTIEAKEK